MLRWHGTTGRLAAADVANQSTQHRVVLQGAALDSADADIIRERLAANGRAVEQVWSAVAYGIWPGHGQLWLADPQASIAVLESSDDDSQRCVLCIASALPREDLTQRLLLAFSADRLVDVVVEDAQS